MGICSCGGSVIDAFVAVGVLSDCSSRVYDACSYILLTDVL